MSKKKTKKAKEEKVQAAEAVGTAEKPAETTAITQDGKDPRGEDVRKKNQEDEAGKV